MKEGHQMKMSAGHILTGDEMEVAAREVRFVSADGREAFAVRPGADGRSIEIRGVDRFKVNGVMYGSTLQVVPLVTNSIIVEAREYKV